MPKKSKLIPWEHIFKNMTESQQQQEYFKLAKRANTRVHDVEKTGVFSYASQTLKKQAKKLFGSSKMKQTKKLQGKELLQGLRTLQQFFETKSSTTKGARESNEKAIEKINKAFENTGSDYKIEKKKASIMLNKLNSEIGKALWQVHILDGELTSDDVFEILENLELKQGDTMDDFLKYIEKLDKFTTGTSTYDAIRKRIEMNNESGFYTNN